MQAGRWKRFGFSELPYLWFLPIMPAYKSVFSGLECIPQVRFPQPLPEVIVLLEGRSTHSTTQLKIVPKIQTKTSTL